MRGGNVSLTVTLTSKSNAALKDAAMLDGMSEAATVNRALQVYTYLRTEQGAGKELAWYRWGRRRWYGPRRCRIEIVKFK